LDAILNNQTIELEGAGFFLEKHVPAPTGLGDSPPLSLEIRLADVGQQKRQLIDNPPNTQRNLASPIDFQQGFAEKWRDLAQYEIALEFLLSKRQFDKTLLIDGGPLIKGPQIGTCSMTQWLERYQSKLNQTVMQLIQAPYPGAGITLLRTLARREAVRASLIQQRLFVLRPSLVGATNAQTSDPYLQETQERLQSEFIENMNRLQEEILCSAELDDLAYHRIELAALDLQISREANASQKALVFDEDPGLPNAPAMISAFPPSSASSIDNTSRERASDTKEQLTHELERKSRYDLITHNCVTELINAVNGSFEGGTEPASFGGHISAFRAQSFIPFRFFELVRHRYPVSRISTIPSFRHRSLRALESSSDPIWEEIKESNTITGTLYKPRDADGVFFFFTDEYVWIRPLLGAVNLGTAMGGMGIGLMGWPFDEGALFMAGARGILFSLPELAFWNIRKGSYSEATLRR
jgi:hypothetical protein